MGAVALVLAACESSTPSASPAAIKSGAPVPSPSTVRLSATPDGSAPATAAPSPTKTPSPAQPPTGSRAAAPMVIPRIAGHGTRLEDGTVLVVGEDACLTAGANPGSERTQLYDPVKDRWTEVDSLNKPRSELSLVARPDGSAMVLGGLNSADEAYSSTKVYVPDAREWSGGPLMVRAGAVGAVTLSDGRIVAAQTGDAEILDTTGLAEWRRSTPPPRSVFILGLFPLANDLVGASAERDDEDRLSVFLIFDPNRETWTEIGSPDVFRPSAIGLLDGSILVFGDDEGGSRVGRYSAANGEWGPAAQLKHSRIRQQMTLLPDGRVLVAGGVELNSQAVDGGYSVTEGRVLKSTEIYDPARDRWSPGPSLLDARQGGLAIPLVDGSVLIFGGYKRTPPEPDVPDTGSPGPCPKALASTERLVVGP